MKIYLKIGAIFFGILLLLANPALAGKTFNLSYFMGPKHPMNKAVFEPFANKLLEVSGGQLNVKQFPGGALNSSPPRQYSILLNGVADIAFAVPGYTAPLFPITNVVAYPNFASTAIEGTDSLLRAFDLVEREYDAKILAVWTNGPSVLVTKDKAVRSLNDLKGMKVRVTSKTDIPFFEVLGASAVSQSVSVINQNLQNGTIDAVAIDPGGIASFKLHESARYVTVGLPASCSAFVLLMNNEVWEGMSQQERSWINEASGEWLSGRGGEAYHAAGIKGLAAAREKGLEIIQLSKAEQDDFNAVVQAEMQKIQEGSIKENLTVADVIKVMKGR